MARSTSSRARRAATPRVPPATRRRQLLDVAARLLTDHGLDSVQITEVASRAAVSRPLVYRLFPTRQALLLALLEDFAETLDGRFHKAVMRKIPGSLEDIITVFVEACFDTIEERGAGPWYLLDARGADPEIARLSHEIHERLLAPWTGQLTDLTGLPQPRAALLSRVVAAAGRAMLQGWLDGVVARADAVRDTTRALAALLAEFSRPDAARDAGR